MIEVRVFFWYFCYYCLKYRFWNKYKTSMLTDTLRMARYMYLLQHCFSMKSVCVPQWFLLLYLLHLCAHFLEKIPDQVVLELYNLYRILDSWHDLSSHLVYPLTTRVVGLPQMILQPVSSIFPCSPLPSIPVNNRKTGIWRRYRWRTRRNINLQQWEQEYRKKKKKKTGRGEELCCLHTHSSFAKSVL